LPKTYPRPGGFESLFPPTQADRIIGQDEGKRSTKTFIRGEKSAIVLALIKSHADNHARAVQLLHHKEKCEDAEGFRACPRTGCSAWLTRDQLREAYPGVLAWDQVHQELVEHYASQEGFSLRVVARVVQLQTEQAAMAESSLRPEGQAGDGKTNGVVKHV